MAKRKTSKEREQEAKKVRASHINCALLQVNYCLMSLHDALEAGDINEQQIQKQELSDLRKVLGLLGYWDKEG